MAIGRLLKGVVTKLGEKVASGLDKVAGDPNSAAAPVTTEPDRTSLSEIDADAAGFPPELR